MSMKSFVKTAMLNRYCFVVRCHFTNFAAPLSAYTDTTNENEKKCRRANCLCDLELVRCMRHYREEFDTDNVGWVTVHQRSCALPAGSLYFRTI